MTTAQNLPTDNKPLVFISAALRNSAWRDRLKQKLDAYAEQIEWWDESKLKRDPNNFEADQIDGAIARASVAVALLSRAYLESDLARVELEDRATAEDYRRHLGLVSLVRKDFEQLSTLLTNSDSINPTLPRIDRIVLYIDDLDRCRTDRVIEVLEAVHLLLAFPLFAVVVAVDPRWLRQSLLDHYPRTECRCLCLQCARHFRHWRVHGYFGRVKRLPLIGNSKNPSSRHL